MPHGLENCCASDAKSVNVSSKDVDRRLICEQVRKPLYGPRQLILDLTTSTVEANSLSHPQGGAAISSAFGRKQTARRTDALCDQGLSDHPWDWLRLVNLEGFPSQNCRVLPRAALTEGDPLMSSPPV